MASSSRRMTRFPLFRTITAALYVFLYAPIAIFILFAFNDSDAVSVWGGFTFRWFGVALANDELQKAGMNTLLIAFSATIFAVLLSIPAALATSSPGRKRQAYPWFLPLVSLPLITPEIVVGIALLSFFSLVGLDLGRVNIIIAHTVFCLPFAYLPIVSRLRSMNPSIMEAADDLYASRSARFRRIILPMLAPGVVAGGMLAFIVSFDNFIISFMVAGAGGTTLPMFIYGLAKTQITPELNALSVMVMLVSLLLLMIAYIVSRGRLLTMGTGD
ncbi:MAG: ABC transporter permease [Pikeienuella sp.]